MNPPRTPSLTRGCVRRARVVQTDGDLYSVQKRLQEEMCRQFYDAFGLRTIVLRPSWIIDSKQKVSRTLPVGSNEWPDRAVCRHHLGQATCGAIRATAPEADFCCLHTVTIPDPPVSTYDPREWCNVGLAAAVLDGFDFTMDLRPLGYSGSRV